LTSMVDVVTNTEGSLKMLESTSIVNGAVFASGLLGFLGVYCESKVIISLHLLANLATSIYGVSVYAYGSTLSDTVGPVAARNGREFCQAGLRSLYETKLGCPNATNTDPCGQECQERVETIKKMGGCEFLHTLCYNNHISEVGYGKCLVIDKRQQATAMQKDLQKPPFMVAGPVSEACCQSACEHSRFCGGFAYETEIQKCRIVSYKAPKWTIATDAEVCGGAFWKPEKPDEGFGIKPQYILVANSDGDKTSICWRRGSNPELTESLNSFCVWMPQLTVVMLVILALSSIPSMFFQYTLVTRRQGDKGAFALLSKLLCPCCRPTRSRQDTAKRQLLTSPSASASSSASSSRTSTFSSTDGDDDDNNDDNDHA